MISKLTIFTIYLRKIKSILIINLAVIRLVLNVSIIKLILFRLVIKMIISFTKKPYSKIL
jgi:hypothetical protein